VQAVSKAKTPLLAGGTALAGLAAGAALRGRAGNGSKLMKRLPGTGGLPMPRLGNGGSTVKALGTAAKEIGKAGYRVGELTAEVRKVREQIK
jgi:hypothetical protein